MMAIIGPDMNRFSVEYFEKNDGSLPVEIFILRQRIKMRARIFRTLELLEIKGNELREPFSKSLGDGFFELRVSQGKDTCRILYFYATDKRVILTNAFTKKTKRIPFSVIVQAKQYRAEYEKRIRNNV